MTTSGRRGSRVTRACNSSTHTNLKGSYRLSTLYEYGYFCSVTSCGSDNSRLAESFEMRQQRPRGTTTREAVVNAALEVVDRLGVEALTIRAVATAVGAPPMSLYTHFANKEELLDLMFGEMAQRLYADPGLDTWQAQLFALANQVRRTLLEHPRWAVLLSRPAQPMSVALRERVLKMMTRAGMTPGDALRAFSSIILVAIGLAFVELTFQDPEGASSFSRRFDRAREWFEHADQSEPTTRQAFASARHFNLGETFELTLQRLIAGFELSGPSKA
jgi:AcrR family transcriptional regulator